MLTGTDTNPRDGLVQYQVSCYGDDVYLYLLADGEFYDLLSKTIHAWLFFAVVSHSLT
jgi:hypothetical protein